MDMVSFILDFEKLSVFSCLFERIVNDKYAAKIVTLNCKNGERLCGSQRI